MSAANIIDVFLHAAGQHPGRVVLQQDRDSITYARLQDAVKRTAAGLRRKGIGKGDAVLVFVPMSVDLYRTVLALFYLGATPVFLDEWVSFGRLKACCELVPCKALIAPAKLRLLAFFIPVLRKIPVKCGPRIAADLPLESPVSVAPGDGALITFTTGSTGIPKAANRTHHFLHAQLRALRPLLEDGIERTLTLLPIVALLNMALGKSTVLPPRRFQSKKLSSYGSLCETLSSARPGSAILSPAILERLLDVAPPAAWAAIRRLLTGGGPVFPHLARKVATKLPHARLTAVYGSTEAEPIAHMDAAELATLQPDAILETGLPLGKVDGHAHVVILPWRDGPVAAESDAALKAISLTDTPGEIVVSGDHVLQHYIGNPAAEQRQKIRTDCRVWHRTGDCGRLDATGKLYLLGRCGEEFTAAGKTHYPLLLEYYLKEKSGAGAVAVMQKDGKHLLVLEAADGEKQPAVKKLAARLGLGEAGVRLVKAIPRDPRHQTKIDKEKLRSLL